MRGAGVKYIIPSEDRVPMECLLTMDSGYHALGATRSTAYWRPVESTSPPLTWLGDGTGVVPQVVDVFQASRLFGTDANSPVTVAFCTGMHHLKFALQKKRPGVRRALFP